MFFARITLEDKAGTEYEPYIFAALHSAKVMIAVGTKPEYFNAVWVKNEWSRFLSLMKKDRSKLLLPCYRDMDPYDLPEQLSVLQSYDMSKIGFLQDLIHGVNKVLDADKKPEPVKETVVVQQNAGGANAVALAKRGGMALEDGEWEKADAFFEDALNLDAECAEAYVGKFLAKNRQTTMESYAQRRLNETSEAVSVRLEAQKPDEARIKAAVQRYTVSGYLEAEELEALYAFDLSYASRLAARKAQSEEGKRSFDTDKLLSRAFRFAKGACKETLEKTRKAYFDALDARVTQAQQADEASIAKIKTDYAVHLKQAEEKATQLYQEAAARREQDYKVACEMQENAKTAEVFGDAAKLFERIGDYADCRARAESCRKEAERLAAEKERNKRRKERNIRIAVALMIVVAIATTLLLKQVILPSRDYSKAEALLAAGDYDAAADAFAALGDYSDAAERVQATRYAKVEALLADGDYYAAAKTFATLGDYKDARERSFELWNTVAVRDTISAGDFHTVGLRSDVTVVAAEDKDYGQCKISDWTDIVSVSAGGSHTVGLRSDGTVVAVGKNDDGQCDVSDWTDIVSVSAGGSHTVGLRSDGTVVAVGYNNHGQCDVSNWTDIVTISAGFQHTVGLRSDGTVVAVGENDDGQCDVGGWTDIVAVSAGTWHTVGLRSDGTVVAVGYNAYGQCKVSGWTDIVAISAGSYHTVGLRSDGTVVAAGDNFFGECNVGGWRNIVSVSAGWAHTVGLRSDGTVVAVGENDDGQCDVSGWADIKIPNSTMKK